MAGQWICLTWSYDFAASQGVGILTDLVNIPGVANPTKSLQPSTTFNLTKAEIWLCDLTKKFNQNTQVNREEEKKKIIDTIS